VTLSDATRTVLLDRMARAWQADLERDGLDANMIARRLARSDAVLRTAPSLLVAFVDLASADTYPDRRRQQAEYDLFMLSGGAAIQNFQVALVAHDVYSAWISAPLFCADVIRSVLAVGPTYRPLGLLAAGYPTATPPAREPRDISTFWRER
jgi:coenzyme F420-0:L-glutamate ligase/coenzyme F420-1:gamma-L-glutamate ligase